MTKSAQPEEDIWAGDLLGRKAEGDYLRRYIERLYDFDKDHQASFVLNINSEWGHGKTWFLKSLCKELRQNRPVIYFDAWKNDFSKDALLSFVSVVCDELAKIFWKDNAVSQKVAKVKATFSLVGKNALPILLAVLSKQLTGRSLEDLGLIDDAKDMFADISDQLSRVVGPSMIDGFINQRNAINDFSRAIGSLVDEIDKSSDFHLPICILIDELDRCRPTYAIELLEAIKHLFSVRGVFFIVATDSSQLAHSIRAVYGSGFNANSYLKRFFSAEYVLATPDYNQFSDFLFLGSNFSESVILPGSRMACEGFFSCCSEFFQLSLRDQEQIFGILKVVLLANEKNKYHFPFLLLLIILRHKFIDSYVRLKINPLFSSFQKMLNDLLGNGNCKDLGITIWQDDGSTGEHILLTHIFYFYMKLAEMDFNGNVSYSQLNPGARFEKTILASVTNNVFSHTKKFSEYFSLVDQAGRFVS